jgi:intracellular multiplication protein IcmT
MNGFAATSHWRDSARSPRFFMVDARAAFPVFIFLLHISWATAFMVVLSAFFFGILEHYGFTIPVFLRWIRGLLAGSTKSAQPWWKK